MGRVSHCFCRCIMLVCGGPCDSLVNVHAFSRTFVLFCSSFTLLSVYNYNNSIIGIDDPPCHFLQRMVRVEPP